MSANLINKQHYPHFFLLQSRDKVATVHLKFSGTKVSMNGFIVHKFSVGEK